MCLFSIIVSLIGSPCASRISIIINMYIVMILCIRISELFDCKIIVFVIVIRDSGVMLCSLGRCRYAHVSFGFRLTVIVYPVNV